MGMIRFHDIQSSYPPVSDQRITYGMAQKQLNIHCVVHGLNRANSIPYHTSTIVALSMQHFHQFLMGMVIYMSCPIGAQQPNNCGCWLLPTSRATGKCPHAKLQNCECKGHAQKRIETMSCWYNIYFNFWGEMDWRRIDSFLVNQTHNPNCLLCKKK